MGPSKLEYFDENLPSYEVLNPAFDEIIRRDFLVLYLCWAKRKLITTLVRLKDDLICLFFST